MNIEEATNLLKGEFGQVLLKEVLNYVIPVAWGVKEDDRWNILANGTAFILDCGEGPFLVTAAHVYEGYLEEKERTPGLRCQLGPMEFKPEERLICCLGEATLDISTLRLERSEIELLKKNVCYGPRPWPPKNVVEGDGVFLGGFPGRERKASANDSFEFGVYVALTPVSSSSERHSGCVYERESWIDMFGKGIPEEGYDMGGVSGGPLFHLVESESGIFAWDLVGVVYNATNIIGEIVLAHHASSILPNGQLRAPT